MSGVLSAAQLGWKNPYATEDNPSALGDPFGGWKGGETPASQSSQNLTGAGKSMQWRTPGREALGSQTIGSWYGMGSSWHEKYTNSD